MLQHTSSEVFFPYEPWLTRAQVSNVIHKASSWECNPFYVAETKRRVHNRKTEYFKALYISKPKNAASI